jgi:methionine-rich copper-binding protein CopC
MKKALQNRLKTYASVAAGVVAASTAGAQIVYTDVNPDVTINTIPSSFDIDFNGDLTPEFQLKLYYSSSFYLARVVPMSPLNEVMATSYVDVLNPNDIISGAQSFVNYGSALEINDWYLDLFELAFSTYSYSSITYSSTGTWGKWGGANTDKYIGVKFDISGNTHYGWIRVDTDFSTTNPSAWSMTIKDFAYQSIPDSSILAGDMGGASLNERFATTKIFAANKQINLSFNEADFSNTQISVYNNLGQLVHQQEAANQKEIIDMSAYPMGMYIVKLQTAGAVLSKKIILK